MLFFFPQQCKQEWQQCQSTAEICFHHRHQRSSLPPKADGPPAEAVCEGGEVFKGHANVSTRSLREPEPALQQVPSGPLSFTPAFPGTHTIRAVLSRIMPGGKPRYHLHSPGNDPLFTARLEQWGPMKHRVCSPPLKSWVLVRLLATEFLLWLCFVRSSRRWQKVWAWKVREHGVLHTRVEVLRSPASCCGKLKLCFEVAGGDKRNAMQHFGQMTALLPGETPKHLFFCQFGFVLGFNKTFKPNQTCLCCCQCHRSAGVSGDCGRVRSYTLDLTNTAELRSQQCEPHHRRVVSPSSWVRCENMLSDEVPLHTALTLFLCL